MFKKNKSGRINSVVAVWIAAILLVTTLGASEKAFAAGESEPETAGTGVPNIDWYTADPDAPVFSIATADELAGLAQIVNGSPELPFGVEQSTFSEQAIELAGDIDLGLDYGATWNGGKGWVPIGDYNTSAAVFQGRFDGNAKTISGLYIDDTGSGQRQYNGLFGYILADGAVENLTLEDVDIKFDYDGASYGGAVAGYVSGSGARLADCATTGAVSYIGANSGACVGGIAGFAEASAVVTDCSSLSTVSGYEDPDGGSDPEPEYTVSYDANGGTDAPESQTKIHDTNLVLSTVVPTRTGGYAFTGWATSSTASFATYQAGGTYTENASVTLYAVWKKTYIITYDANGGKGAPASQIKIQDECLKLSNEKPTRAGYVFMGWSTDKKAKDATYTEGDDYDDDASITLYAVWRVAYKITYNANGGKGAPGKQTKIHGITLILSSTKPTRSGYVFDGWATSSTAQASAYKAGGKYTANEAATLYAVWKATYKITYNANGGTGAPGKQTKIQDTNLKLSTTKPTRTGYNFLGWSTSKTATSAKYQAGGTYTANKPATLYAVWKPKEYTVSYYANGGKNAPASQKKIHDKSLKLRKKGPTRDGYVFNGWATSSTTKTVAYKAGGTYTKNKPIKLYAVWAKKYNISYDANGGTGAPAGQTKIEGVSLTLSSKKPTKPGNKFLGWSTSSTAKTATYKAGGTYTKNEAAKLYAVWEKLLKPEDRYSFPNATGYYHAKNYYMTNNDFKKLSDYVKKEYKNDSEYAKAVINDLQWYRAQKWGGSCYGMSSTAILDKKKKIDMKRWIDPDDDEEYECLGDLPLPIQDSKLESAINYYHISQAIPFVWSRQYNINDADWGAGLKSLVNNAKKGKLIMFNYVFLDCSRGYPEGPYGHSIVIIDYKPGANGSHDLIAYDNRQPKKNIIVNISGDFQTCWVDWVEYVGIVEPVSDMSKFDKIKIDKGGYSAALSALDDEGAELSASDDVGAEPVGANISISAGQSQTIMNEAGQTLVYDADTGEVSGTMPVLNRHMIVRSAMAGAPAPATLVFTVPGSEKFTFEADGKGLDISVVSSDIYAAATSEQADSIVVANDEGISVLGDGEIEFSATLGLNNDVCDMVSLDGVADQSGGLLFNDAGAVAQGNFDESTTVTVFSDTVNVEEIEFSTPHKEVLVTRAAGKFGLKASSKKNGKFDKNVPSKRRPRH